MVQWTETCRQVFNIDYKYTLCYWQINYCIFKYFKIVSFQLICSIGLVSTLQAARCYTKCLQYTVTVAVAVVRRCVWRRNVINMHNLAVTLCSTWHVSCLHCHSNVSRQLCSSVLWLCENRIHERDIFSTRYPEPVSQCVRKCRLTTIRKVLNSSKYTPFNYDARWGPVFQKSVKWTLQPTCPFFRTNVKGTHLGRNFNIFSNNFDLRYFWTLWRQARPKLM